MLGRQTRRLVRRTRGKPSALILKKKNEWMEITSDSSRRKRKKVENGKGDNREFSSLFTKKKRDPEKQAIKAVSITASFTRVSSCFKLTIGG